MKSKTSSIVLLLIMLLCLARSGACFAEQASAPNGLRIADASNTIFTWFRPHLSKQLEDRIKNRTATHSEIITALELENKDEIFNVINYLIRYKDDDEIRMLLRDM
jgi:hypothetical protein